MIDQDLGQTSPWGRSTARNTSASSNMYSPASRLFHSSVVVCGTLKCENAAICEKVAKCEKKSTLNVKIDAICEKNNAKCEKMRAVTCITKSSNDLQDSIAKRIVAHPKPQ